MTDRDRISAAFPRRLPLPRPTTGVLVAVMGCAVAAAFVTGCGSSSDGPPFPEFEGRWAVDADTSTLSCPQTTDLMSLSFSPWSNTETAGGGVARVVALEAGVLTDLVDTARPCVFGFDVKGTVGTVPDIDPYSGKPPVCVVPVNGDGSSTAELTSQVDHPLTFQLAKPVKGMAQQAFITGAADVTLFFLNSVNEFDEVKPCTLAAQVGLHKITKL
jgi:hypothetical protein